MKAAGQYMKAGGQGMTGYEDRVSFILRRLNGSLIITWLLVEDSALPYITVLPLQFQEAI